MLRFTSRWRGSVRGLFFVFPSLVLAAPPDLSLRIDPVVDSNGWAITLHEAIPSNAYTLVASPNLAPGSWQDTTVIQAGTGLTSVAQVGTAPTESARFFMIRESSAEDFDGDRLNNRAEFEAGCDPTQADTDGDRFTDYEEVVLDATDPTDQRDGAEAIEECRRQILAKWALIYPTPPVFTNPPGTPDDLLDLENLLRQLSGVFFTSKE